MGSCSSCFLRLFAHMAPRLAALQELENFAHLRFPTSPSPRLTSISLAMSPLTFLLASAAVSLASAKKVRTGSALSRLRRVIFGRRYLRILPDPISQPTPTPHRACPPLQYNTAASRVEGAINVHLVPHTHDDVSGGWGVGSVRAAGAAGA